MGNMLLRRAMGMGMFDSSVEEIFDWYVDSVGGNDARTGKSQAEALKTFSALAGKSVVAGEKVGLKRGSEFRELLTAQSSGGVGQPITYKPYGSGAAPIVSGADLITSAWSHNWSTNQVYGHAGTTNQSGVAGWNVRILIPANFFTINGSKIKITIEAASNSQVVVASAWIGEQDPSVAEWNMVPGTITQFLFSGSGGVTIAQGVKQDSDELAYTYDKTKKYIVSIGFTSGNVAYSIITGGHNHLKTAAAANAGDAVITGMSASYSELWGFDFLTIIDETGGSQANTWATPVSNDPGLAWFDGHLGSKKTTLVGLVADYDFYWASGYLYTYTSDDADPGTKYASVEAVQRSTAILGNSKNYLTFDGLHITKCNTYGIYTNGSNNIIKNCIFDYSEAAINTYGDAAVVQNNTITNCRVSGVNVIAGTGTIVELNEISACWNGGEYGSGGAGKAIYISGGIGGIIRYNRVHDNYIGIHIITASDTQVYYNLVYNTRVNGIDHNSGVAGHPVLIYNNTVLNNPSALAALPSGHAIVCQLGGSSTKVKNNLIIQTYTGTNINVNGLDFADSTYTEIDTDYNLTYKIPGSTSDLYKLDLLLYNTLADWKTALASTGFSGKGEHDLSADPLVVSVITPDFHIQALSPCIGAGINVGLSRDFDGVAVPDPPTIGAFEYVS